MKKSFRVVPGREVALSVAVTVLEVIQRSAAFLAKKGVDSPRLQVELLLAHVLKVPRLRLYLDFDRTLTVEELDAVRALIKQRANREPLQHIIGSTSFCGLEIKVTPDVLIPRPETEILAEKAWQFLGAFPGRGGAIATALDFGTGSGCLAIALAIKCPTAQVYAVDISGPALKVARENAVLHSVAERIRFLESNAFESLPAGLRFDLIVANPPYIPRAEIATLAPEVRRHDPYLALDGGEDGLDFYRRLAADAPVFLDSNAKIMCEFGDDQAKAVGEIFKSRQWIIEALEPDLTGRERILTARPPES